MNGLIFTFLYVPNTLGDYNPNLSWYNENKQYKRILEESFISSSYKPHKFSIMFASHLNQNGQMIMPTDFYFEYTYSLLLHVIPSVCTCLCATNTRKKWVIFITLFNCSNLKILNIFIIYSLNISF